MMVEEEIAWVAKEFASGRMQTEIGSELGYTASTICVQIKNFCDRWSGVDVSGRQAYGDERRRYANIAVVNYSKQQTRIRKPPPYTSASYHWRDAAALNEHAWTLRLEGLTYREIGRRMDISPARVKQRVKAFSRRMAKAMRRARFTIYAEGKEPPTRDWLMVSTEKEFISVQSVVVL